MKTTLNSIAIILTNGAVFFLLKTVSNIIEAVNLNTEMIINYCIN